jgi:uncharacterized membrane protein
MGKAARKKKSQAKPTKQAPPPNTPPNWLLLGLALAGMALTGYLTVAAWQGQTLAGCVVGSSCDIVLSSRWSRLFGLPTSLWGFVTYALLAGCAFLKRDDTRWRITWMAALFGVLYSAYLTGISLIELDAACPYCLTSLALFVAILGAAVYQRPKNMAQSSWRPWLMKTLAAGLLGVLAIHLHYAGILGEPPAPEEPRLRALAVHLTESGAKFYGAFWCPHCDEQKEMFGSSASRLPYIECSPGGRNAPQARICRDAGIQSYPTWVINGKRHAGVLSTGELAEYAGFKEPLTPRN